ncbi:MAG: M48 family metallopeptidase [Anaerolineales bacterium]|jgi:predicted metal-dependent hydrolase
MTDFHENKPATLPEALETAVPRELFLSEVSAWATRIGVDVREVRIRPMKRKWASCSSRHRITFDTDLLCQPASFRREAIVHELVHLKVPNHGKLFSSLVRSYLAVCE